MIPDSWPVTILSRMTTSPFADHLASLDETALTELLEHRPDVLLEPAPHDVGELAERLDGVNSLAAAMPVANANEILASQAVAALGDTATEAAIRDLLGAREDLVHDAVSGLLRRGLAWRHGERLGLPDKLAEHWVDGIGGGAAIRSLARSLLAEDLRAAAGALDAEQGSRRKPDLVEHLANAYADQARILVIARRLSSRARELLEAARQGGDSGLSTYYTPRDRHDSPLTELMSSGLVVRRQYRGLIVPREVAVALWVDGAGGMTDRPELPDAPPGDDHRAAAARAAAQAAVQAVTTLLDDATLKPIAALKKGGVGKRERARLATALTVAGQELPLWIDLAYTAGLLAHHGSGYTATVEYPRWREADPGQRWAALACAWFACEHAPTDREIDDGQEQPPPLPLGSSAGLLRRALLRAARPAASVSAAGDVVDWHCPLHGYHPEQYRDEKLAAAIREAELLGVVANDGLTELGSALLDAAQAPDISQQCERLAEVTATLLPTPPWSVILQSDLTAIVAGQPPATVARLLGEAAKAEARGAAGVWRFSAATVRAAMDKGWTADELLTGLNAMNDRDIPQPLAYLVRDVARRHGHIRVRGARSVLVTDEATATEILHTGLARKRHLTQIAPGVLGSPHDIDEILAALRDAGFAPVAEDALGEPITDEAPHSKPAQPQVSRARIRVVSSPARVLAKQLLSPQQEEPDDDAGDTYRRLADLNPRLSAAELHQLAYALENNRDVRITYRNRQGSSSTRNIQPNKLYGKWLDSWCHLRRAQRDFTVANIQAVEPA